MMRLEQPEISTSLRKRKIVVPGGWFAYVPEVAVKELDVVALGRYFSSVYGAKPSRARAETIQRVQQLFTSCWLRQLHESVRRWARVYAGQFPALRQLDGTLAGFDPEKLQMAGGFVPRDNTGRRGKHWVRDTLTQMARGELAA